jgi:hypothetical protein
MNSMHLMEPYRETCDLALTPQTRIQEVFGSNFGRVFRDYEYTAMPLHQAAKSRDSSAAAVGKRVYVESKQVAQWQVLRLCL